MASQGPNPDPPVTPPRVITGPNIVLGSSPEAPRRRPPHESPVYAARVATGLYDSIADQIANMKTDALANLDYPDNFTRQIEDWSKNHKYIGADGKELRTAIVGEVMGPALGTIIRAHGNYYARDGDDFKPIDDKTKVKDSVALGVPTFATTKLYNTVLNQAICATQVADSNADEDRRNGVFPIVKPWTKPSKDGSNTHDVIVVHMLPKYAVPVAAGAPRARRTAKRKLDDAIDEEPEAAPKAAEDVEIPSDEDIKLGAHYEPSLLEDYGGPFFNHVKGKLVQQDVRDKNNNLIPPWKIYEALRPGTLVLVLGTLHCFVMVDDSGKERKERKIYQINGHSWRILDESDEPVEKRTRPHPPVGAERVTANLPARSALSSFDSFVIPTPPTTPASSASGGPASLQNTPGSPTPGASGSGAARAAGASGSGAPAGTSSSASSTTADSTEDNGEDVAMEDATKTTSKARAKRTKRD